MKRGPINETDQLSALRSFLSPASPRELMTFGSPSAGTGTRQFRVTLPGCPVRFKLTLNFIPANDTPPTGGLAGTLWLYEAEDDTSGMLGGTIPCVDIEGHSDAPATVPKHVGLWGYSKEFLTAADNIEGIFTCVGNDQTVGTWTIQARVQPAAIAYTAEEWEKVRSAVAVALVGGTPRLG
jgi:hypothetical protein